MDFNRDADLDTSNITDEVYDGGGGGGGGGGFGGRIALGGGGVSVVGIIIYLLLSQLGGGGGGGLGGALPDLAGGAGPVQSEQPGSNPNDIHNSCRTGHDVDTNPRCEVALLSNSIEDYWRQEFQQSGRRYSNAGLHVFQGDTQTGCGAATADVGPFYCPADKNVYIDISFYNELTQRFGAKGGAFAHAYVLAHEYGHHVQDLLGQSAGGSATGATSGSVRLELQADCYAGVWANHATTVTTRTGKPLITNISQGDIDAALDTASRIGDDFIQSQLAHQQVNSGQFTHGTSAQREKWLTTGLQTGDPAKCNTFARGVNLG